AADLILCIGGPLVEPPRLPSSGSRSHGGCIAPALASSGTRIASWPEPLHLALRRPRGGARSRGRGSGMERAPRGPAGDRTDQPSDGPGPRVHAGPPGLRAVVRIDVDFTTFPHWYCRGRRLR